jgi:hypothetical protein
MTSLYSHYSKCEKQVVLTGDAWSVAIGRAVAEALQVANTQRPFVVCRQQFAKNPTRGGAVSLVLLLASVGLHLSPGIRHVSVALHPSSTA